jgi:hypothetical protein
LEKLRWQEEIATFILLTRESDTKQNKAQDESQAQVK